MDTRNYNEPADCGLGSCDCREDNTCGCSFPNNISNYCSAEDNCAQLSQENIEIKTAETHIKKNATCFCTPKECDCSIERSEVSK